MFDPALEEKAIILLNATHWTSIAITLAKHPVRIADQLYVSVEENLLNGHAAFIYIHFFAMNCTKQHEEI